MRGNKLREGWTPDTLARRIAEGERLLEELRSEPPWMSELVSAELVRKRQLLQVLRAEPVLAH